MIQNQIITDKTDYNFIGIIEEIWMTNVYYYKYKLIKIWKLDTEI